MDRGEAEHPEVGADVEQHQPTRGPHILHEIVEFTHLRRILHLEVERALGGVPRTAESPVAADPVIHGSTGIVGEPAHGLPGGPQPVAHGSGQHRAGQTA